MIDINCHLLPCTKEGCGDISDYIKMVETVKSEGIEKIIATPCFSQDLADKMTNESVTNEVDKLNEVLLKKKIDVIIYPGSEISIFPGMDEFFKRKMLISLNGSRYFLIKLPDKTIPQYTQRVLFDLRQKGVFPVLANPEKNEQVIKSPEILFEIVKLGVHLQVNSRSLIGDFGPQIEKTAWKLIENSFVSFVASGWHLNDEKEYSMKKAYRKFIERFGITVGQQLFYENPLKVINHDEIMMKEPVKPKKKGLFGLFGK